jgi:triacylglycerol esterase/lipase EstA (alpha/beta hydrolase family)
MKRILWLFVLVVILFIFPALSLIGPTSAKTQITILDLNGNEVSKLVDGNSIRLRISLDEAVKQPALVAFSLDSPGYVVAGCPILAGEKSCQSDPFRSLGWFWGPTSTASSTHTVLASMDGVATEASASIMVAPRPVVMVHGFLSNYQAWANYLGPQGYLARIGVPAYAVGDGQAPGVLNTGDITDPQRRTNTIAQNAVVLQGYIAEVKRQTGAEMVDLLGHSMGGMIARYYIDRLMGDNVPGRSGRDVAQLIMLGTPHLGSDCANLPVALGWYLPAALEIRSSYARQILNPQIYHHKGVPFFELAGDPILQPAGSPCTAVPSDIVVSLDSASGVPVELSKIAFMHTELNTSPKVFDEFVKALVEKRPVDFTDVADPPAPSPDLGEPLQFSRIYTGKVAAGGSQTLTINIEAGVSVASFALFDANGTLDVTVVGASGKVIVLDPVKNGLRKIDDANTLVNLGYGFDQPKEGAWHILLKATDRTPAAGVDYALTAKFIGGSLLHASTDKVLPQVGEPVQLNASLTLNGAPLTIESAEAQVRAPDGSTQSVKLTTRGNTSTASWTPQTAGLYGIDLHVTANSPDNIPVDRVAFLTVEAQPKTGSPNGTGPSINPNSRLMIMGGLALLVLVGAAGVTGGLALIWLFFQKRRS